jgi:hypothetical protein
MRYQFPRGNYGLAVEKSIARMHSEDGKPGRDATNSRHFSEMWPRSFSGFLRHAGKQERIYFASELLPNWAVFNSRHVEINYARMKQGPNGPIEETDRWSEALLLCEMAQAAFQQA